jgi:hypothetical protein
VRGVVQIMPTEHDPLIRELHLSGFVGMADGDYDIAVASEVFYQRSSLLSVEPISGREKHYRISALGHLGHFDWRVPHGMGDRKANAIQ